MCQGVRGSQGELLGERVEEENDVKTCGCGSRGDGNLEGMGKVEFLVGIRGVCIPHLHSPPNTTLCSRLREFHSF